MSMHHWVGHDAYSVVRLLFNALASSIDDYTTALQPCKLSSKCWCYLSTPHASHPYCGYLCLWLSLLPCTYTEAQYRSNVSFGHPKSWSAPMCLLNISSSCFAVSVPLFPFLQIDMTTINYHLSAIMSSAARCSNVLSCFQMQHCTLSLPNMSERSTAQQHPA